MVDRSGILYVHNNNEYTNEFSFSLDRLEFGFNLNVYTPQRDYCATQLTKSNVFGGWFSVSFCGF